jgi:6-phosphofructokinase 1
MTVSVKRVGVLTGGGDAPGLNAVIRAIVVMAENKGMHIIGIRRGWAGLLDGGEVTPLSLEDVDDIHRTGGTVLGSSRTNPAKHPDGMEQVERNLKRHGCDALIAIGGDDTLGVFGFDTAINIATEALDRLHTTAKSHDRVIVVEIMGRYSGWLTFNSGMSGGAHIILLPEEKFDIEEICGVVKKRRDTGYNYTIIAVSEGATPSDTREFITQDDKLDEFGHVKLGGIANRLAKVIEDKTGQETRSVVLGHIQRGGAPTAFDRVTGTRLGVKAVQLIVDGEFGQMSSLRGSEIVAVPIAEALGETKLVDKARLEEVKLFMGR